MMRRYGLCSMVIAAFLSTAGPAAAQNGGAPLASLLPTLVLRDISLPPAAAPGRPHESHFTPLNPLFEGLTTDLLAIPSVQAVLNVNRILASQFSTFPLGSS